tara:strand:+ start:351 stop:881 length:531 start_codon:yes stop_codon:yes gene_type:complete
MWMQTVNRSDNERVWVNFTNTDGQTITAYSPVSKMFWTNAKSLSIAANEGNALVANVNAPAGGISKQNLIGVAYEDVANADVGIAQVYGYCESVMIAPWGGAATTIRVGEPMVPDATTVGFVSTGAVLAKYAVIALDTIQGGAEQTGNASSNTHAPLSAGLMGERGWANHVFVRCL